MSSPRHPIEPIDVNLTPPFRVEQSAVYVQIVDAHERLVAFMGMNLHARARAQAIVSILNQHWSDDT